MLSKIKLLGIEITNESEDKILEYLLSGLEDASKKYFIVTPNPEILVYANDHPGYKKILNSAQIALPDGIGVFLGSAFIGNILKERIAGVDFMEEICRRSNKKAIKVGFLGGRDGVAEQTAECLVSRYPWLNVVFAAEEWDEDRSKSKDTPRGTGQRSKPKLKTKNDLQIDILFVAFGHPKQEEWIYDNLDKLPVRAAMGVGGSFDYFSGKVSRAPFMVRAMGFEWLYRLVKEPWRWRRQLALPKFVWLVLKERIGASKVSSEKKG